MKNNAACTYRHTQIGYAILVALAVAELTIVLAAYYVGRTTPPGHAPTPIRPILALTGFVIGCVALLFSSLTIQVTDGMLRWHFTCGIIRGSIALRDVEQVTPVRNSPAFGWGYHITPSGTLWNVSGLGAVEVLTRDGRRFRLGSDEPERLAHALDALKPPAVDR